MTTENKRNFTALVNEEIKFRQNMLSKLKTINKLKSKKKMKYEIGILQGEILFQNMSLASFLDIITDTEDK